MTESDTTEQTAKEIIERVIPYRYPNYNMGILPDEDGYDSIQVHSHYDIDEQRMYAEAAINAHIAQTVVSVLEEAHRANGGHDYDNETDEYIDEMIARYKEKGL